MHLALHLLVIPLLALTAAVLAAGDAGVTIAGELKQWHRVDLSQSAVASTVSATPNPFLDYRFNVAFTAPSGRVLMVPGYFAADGAGGLAGNHWTAHLNPDEIGTWNYTISFRSGIDVAVSLAPDAGTAVAPYDSKSGTFQVHPSDKTGDDFRAPDKGMLVNRGAHYLTYGGSGRPFIFTGPGIPENILGYRGFTNTMIGIGHVFDTHLVHWKSDDPDWGDGQGRRLIGALNYIADNGGNTLYLMSQTIGGDGKDCFPHPTPSSDKTRYDLLKLAQWDIALAHAQRKGIYLHWVLAENETENYTYYGGTAASGSLSTARKLYFRMMNARFGHYNALKWNLMEEVEWNKVERAAQAAYIKAIDPYDHPITFQAGGVGLPYSSFDEHLGNADFDALSFQGNASRASMFNTISSYLAKADASGVKWTAAWDEPQKIENNTKEDVGYPMGRRDKMWPCLMAGGDGFLWYVQADGGGHGFDQRIEDLAIMRDSFRWSGYARDFLAPLPLLEMTSSRTLTTSPAGSEDYTLAKTGEVYAIFNDRVGTGMSLDLSAALATTTFSVSWFDPRNGGALQAGSVTTVDGGGLRDLGSAPSATDQDWAVLVQHVADNSPVNQAPQVDAGPQGSIILPGPASLDGAVNDDGLPIGGGVITAWSLVSGPGEVTFANAAAIDTIASFTVPGSYVLCLTASDGALSASDTVTITVAALPTDQSLQVNTGGSATDGFAADTGFSGGSTYSTNVAVDTAGIVGAGPPAIYQTERFGNVTYLISGLIPSINGVVRLHFSEIYFTAAGRRIFDVSVNGTPVLDDLDIFAAAGGANRALVREFPVTASASGTITIAFTSVVNNAKISGIEVMVATPVNQVPMVHAGPDRNLTLPALANLDGTVSDDGLPGADVTVSWSMISGPGQVAFANAAAIDTTVSFTVTGTYILRLTASDGTLSASDQMQVIVQSDQDLQAVISFSLIDADSDLAIPGYDPLPANAVLDLTLLPTRHLNLRANTSPAIVGSVRFAVDAVSSYRTESVAPYALAGDNSGDFQPWNLGLGTHSVTATPYTLSGAKGSAGTALSTVLTILDATPAITGNG